VLKNSESGRDIKTEGFGKLEVPRAVMKWGRVKHLVLTRRRKTEKTKKIRREKPDMVFKKRQRGEGGKKFSQWMAGRKIGNKEPGERSTVERTLIHGGKESPSRNG